MARDDTNIVNALNQSEVELWNAVDLKLDNRTLRFWTGTGDRSLGGAVSAGQVVIGEQYEIVTTGNTDFTKIGASQNTVGLKFFATGKPGFTLSNFGGPTGTVKTVYTGTSNLMGLGGVTEVTDLSAQSAQLTFNGITSDILSLALSEPYQRRECIIYFGVGSGPFYMTEVFSGEIDTLSISDSAETSTITLSVSSRLIKLDRANVRKYTSENHKSRYPNETFFDAVAAIQDQSIVWGRDA